MKNQVFEYEYQSSSSVHTSGMNPWLDEGAVTVTVPFNLRFKVEEEHVNFPSIGWLNLDQVFPHSKSELLIISKTWTGCWTGQNNLCPLNSQNRMPHIQNKNPGVEEDQGQGTAFMLLYDLGQMTKLSSYL